MSAPIIEKAATFRGHSFERKKSSRRPHVSHVGSRRGGKRETAPSKIPNERPFAAARELVRPSSRPPFCPPLGRAPDMAVMLKHNKKIERGDAARGEVWRAGVAAGGVATRSGQPRLHTATTAMRFIVSHGDNSNALDSQRPPRLHIAHTWCFVRPRVTVCTTAFQPSAAAACVTHLSRGGSQELENEDGHGRGVGGEVSGLSPL